MKLRRSLLTAAATAALVPLALLTLNVAPAAFAEENGTPSAGTTESQDSTASPTGTQSGTTPSASDTTSPSASGTPSGHPGEPQAASSSQSSSSQSSSQSSSATPSSSAPSSAGASEDPFDPARDCRSVDWDDDLSATLTGLPGKIVAGSGWHDFTYVVENNTDADIKNVYLATYLEYDEEEIDDFLSDGLAVIQVKEDGKWTDAYQQSWGEGDDTINISSSFVALLDELKKDTSVTFDLRVKVKASAPAGSSLAMSEAVYAAGDSACHVSGDEYDVTILAAGSGTGGASDAGEATPNGDRPTDRTRPQGGARPISGSLASTGADSPLPLISLVGGVAVVAGAGAVFAARRRKAGAHV
ncbi:LPXTG cell wall anchor domain-containing protein [Streptomyces sp. NPDC002920]